MAEVIEITSSPDDLSRDSSPKTVLQVARYILRCHGKVPAKRTASSEGSERQLSLPNEEVASKKLKIPAISPPKKVAKKTVVKAKPCKAASGKLLPAAVEETVKPKLRVKATVKKPTTKRAQSIVEKTPPKVASERAKKISPKEARAKVQKTVSASAVSNGARPKVKPLTVPLAPGRARILTKKPSITDQTIKMAAKTATAGTLTGVFRRKATSTVTSNIKPSSPAAGMPSSATLRTALSKAPAPSTCVPSTSTTASRFSSTVKSSPARYEEVANALDAGRDLVSHFAQFMDFLKAAHDRDFPESSLDDMGHVEPELDEVELELDKVEPDIPEEPLLEESRFEEIECTCCYNEVPFDYLVQCTDGHLFCIQCLQRYVEESVYGQGKGILSCLSEGCEAGFPESQLLRALPEKLKQKYDERIQEEMLNKAHLDDLIRCPFCNCGAELYPTVQFFTCPNPTCQKESCRYCQVVFEDHKGLKCDEIEQEQETVIRKEYEEKMTNAKIRQCHKCLAPFTKETGCNKITCRCLANMCYICRIPINDYSHFCPHVRSPGKKCSKCVQCSLWTNAGQDDDLAIREIKESVAKVRKDLGFEDEKDIGAPNTEFPAPAVPQHN